MRRGRSNETKDKNRKNFLFKNADLAVFDQRFMNRKRHLMKKKYLSCHCQLCDVLIPSRKYCFKVNK